jgi:Loader and inhibitor of phage G40P.
MTKSETALLMAKIEAIYPNFKTVDKKLMVEAWHSVLANDDNWLISEALVAYAQTDRSGFAPTVGQLHGLIVDKLTQPEEFDEGEILHRLIMASRNANYGYEDEFNRLPNTLQRAVGSPSVLREWGTMEQDDLQYAFSRIIKAHRDIINRQKVELAVGGLNSRFKELANKAVKEIGHER